jgi:hypothetical protein
LARFFAQKGDPRPVAVLAQSTASINQTGYDNWDQGTDIYQITLNVPFRLFSQIEEVRNALEESILSAIRVLLRGHEGSFIASVLISTELSTSDNWREKALEWVSGKGVTNQGRVRSDNIATRSEDGLLFRSEPEVNLYKALKSLGVSFAPLPVSIRGGRSYKRIEPDFVVFKGGLPMIIEVDGDTVHLETPAEAHARTTMLMHEGAHIERVSSSECDTEQKAVQCATRLLGVLEKHKAAK